METTVRAQARLHERHSVREVLRLLPAEVAVAFSYNGTTQAVMMATPDDLEDFAVGFSLSEGIAGLEEIEGVVAVETELGVDLQIRLREEAGARLVARRRSMAGPVGCGLCGIESLEEAMRSAPSVAATTPEMTSDAVREAVGGLRAHQPLHDRTHAAHVAAFWAAGAGIVFGREDVGRHNALDKLIGALARGASKPAGAVLVSSRVSIDLVQKCARAGVAVLIGVSAPTAAAVVLAEAAGLTLIGCANDSRFEVFSAGWRISQEETAHVG